MPLIETINVSDPNTNYEILDLNIEENLALLAKHSLLTEHKKGIILKNKKILRNKSTNDLLVLKENSFSPHKGFENMYEIPDMKLEISTAINEFLWYSYAKTLGIDSYFVPVSLMFYTVENNNKFSKKICSSTILLQDYKNLYYYSMLQDTSIYEKLNSNFVLPDEIRMFYTFAGYQLTKADVLLNIEGDIKVVDMADAHPDKVQYTLNNLYNYLGMQSDSNYIVSFIRKAQEMLKTLIEQKENIIAHVYSHYDQINLRVSPLEGNKPIGLSKYVDIWMNIIKDLNTKLEFFNEQQMDIDSIIVPVVEKNNKVPMVKSNLSKEEAIQQNAKSFFEAPVIEPKKRSIIKRKIVQI